MFSLRTFVPAIALFAIAAPAAGQSIPRAIEAPKALVEPLGLKGGNVQRLVLPFNHRKPFSQIVVLGGKPRTLDLEPTSYRSADFGMFEQDDRGNWRQIQAPVETTYGGVVRGYRNSIVVVGLYQGQLLGTVTIGEKAWGIEPATQVNRSLPRTAHIVYSTTQVKPVDNICKVDDGITTQIVNNGTAAAGAANKTECLYHVTKGFQNNYGGRFGALNQIEIIHGNVKAIYNRDVNINKVIRGIWFARGTFTNSQSALTQFQNAWRGEPAFRRDVAQAFMPFPSSSAPLGIAYLSTICNSSNHYSVCWNNSNVTVRIVTSAHEYGHSWSAPHCSGSSCWVMCAFVGGCGGLRTQFGTTSKNRIIAFRNTRNCLN